MNVSTEANPQDILSQHYNQANEFFQQGEFQKALDLLAVARQYAADEHQLQHIESTIATVKQNMGQTVAAAPEVDNTPEETMEATPPEKSRPNSMLVLTILVGLVCITPIAMKFIEIFSQPRPDSTVNAVAETTTETTSETTDPEGAESVTGVVATDANAPTPESTAAVIVNAEQPDAVQNTQVGSTVSMTINASNVNMRAEASVSASRVATLSQGTQVEAVGQTVSADGFEWQQIKTTSGATGWIASRFLQANATVPASNAVATTTTSATTPAATSEQPASTPAVEGAAAAGAQMRIAGTGISVRTTPSTSGQRLIALSNTQVTVLEPKAMEADGYTWSKIRTENGTEGWVAHQFLSP